MSDYRVSRNAILRLCNSLTHECHPSSMRTYTNSWVKLLTSSVFHTWVIWIANREMVIINKHKGKTYIFFINSIGIQLETKSYYISLQKTTLQNMHFRAQNSFYMTYYTIWHQNFHKIHNPFYLSEFPSYRVFYGLLSRYSFLIGP